ncbi:unnamed protein product, partial [Phaeothamnion confervicola]
MNAMSDDDSGSHVYEAGFDDDRVEKRQEVMIPEKTQPRARTQPPSVVTAYLNCRTGLLTGGKGISLLAVAALRDWVQRAQFFASSVTGSEGSPIHYTAKDGGTPAAAAAEAGAAGVTGSAPATGIGVGVAFKDGHPRLLRINDPEAALVSLIKECGVAIGLGPADISFDCALNRPPFGVYCVFRGVRVGPGLDGKTLHNATQRAVHKLMSILFPGAPLLALFSGFGGSLTVTSAPQKVALGAHLQSASAASGPAGDGGPAVAAGGAAAGAAPIPAAAPDLAAAAATAAAAAVAP